MNGRLRVLPDTNSERPSIISIAPCTLPHGFITLHNTQVQVQAAQINPHSKISSTEAVNFTSLGILETHRSMGEVIVDHCWTILMRESVSIRVSSKERSHNKILILAKLTRKRGQIITTSKEADISQNHHTCCTLLSIHWRDAEIGNMSTSKNKSNSRCANDTNTDADADVTTDPNTDTIDETFPNVVTMALPYIASSVMMNDRLLVIGSSSGAIFYELDHFIMGKGQNVDDSTRKYNGKRPLRHDSIHSVKILNNYMVHAMDISSDHFVVVSGEQVGLWRVDNISRYMNAEISHSKKSPFAADWSTTLVGWNRITSARLSTTNKEDNCIEKTPFLALASWDGSVVLLQKQQKSECWDRVTDWIGSVAGGNTDVDEETTNNMDHGKCPPWEQATAGHGQLSPCFAEVVHLLEGCKFFLVVTIPMVCAIRIFDLKKQCTVNLVMSNAIESKWVWSLGSCIRNHFHLSLTA